jgi:hypothetical protein
MKNTSPCHVPSDMDSKSNFARCDKQLIFVVLHLSITVLNQHLSDGPGTTNQPGKSLSFPGSIWKSRIRTHDLSNHKCDSLNSALPCDDIGIDLLLVPGVEDDEVRHDRLLRHTCSGCTRLAPCVPGSEGCIRAAGDSVKRSNL